MEPKNSKQDTSGAQDTPVFETTGPRGQFSLLSHDLRSALADILGGVRLINRQALDKATRIQIDRIEAAGQVLVGLLDAESADNAPGDAPTQRPSTALELNGFLDLIRKRWAARAAEKGLAFSIDNANDLPRVAALDRVTLERVIGNLISNAVKFTDTGKVVLSVSLEDDGSLCFCIRDDGPGMSPRALEQLFRYAARPGGMKKPGSGLGLYIAKELAGHIGGSLEIGNRAEGGVEATFRIPAAIWAGNKREFPVIEAPPDLTGLRILVAEDNLTNQMVVAQMIEAMGADFVLAADGREALSLARAGHFDLALLDIEMPRMNGLELIHALRASPPPLADMPLVALTAYVMREHRDRIFAAGADGIISKPILSLSAFGNEIRHHLERNRATAISGDARVAADADSVVDRVVYDHLIETIGPAARGELLEKLRLDATAVAQGLRRGLDAGDMAVIRERTHVLISVAGAIGARRLQDVAQRLNAAARRKAPDEVAALSAVCLDGLNSLQSFIHAESLRVTPGWYQTTPGGGRR